MKSPFVMFEFGIVDFGTQFSFVDSEKTAGECLYKDDKIHFYAYYDVKDEPLHLGARAEIGDNCKIVIYDFRVELYVNGALADEEWPFGNHFLEAATLENNAAGVSITFGDGEEEIKPSVIASFENAEGWKPEENVFVGDCMPYFDNGRYHVLYLKDRHHHRSKWGFGAHQWEHISTEDMVHFDIHPMAVPITDKSEGSICTGSHIRCGDKHYLYYTVRPCSFADKAYIRRSVSYDGYHFVKDEGYGFALSDKYNLFSARDPKVIKDKNGLFHMILTSSLVSEKRGCLVHLVSKDLESFEEMPEPIYISHDEREPECSDYFEYNGRYYLVYSLSGRAYYKISDSEFDGFASSPEIHVPCGSVPKAAKFGDSLIFTGFIGEGGYAGRMTFLKARADDEGKLVFEEKE